MLAFQQVDVQLIAVSPWLHHVLKVAAMLVVSNSSPSPSQSRADPATHDCDLELGQALLLPSES